MKYLFLVTVITLNVFTAKAQDNEEKDMEISKINRTISLEAAQLLTVKGVALAKEKSLNVAIAIVDDAGNLVAFVKMDDSAIVTIDTAIQKAKTAAFLKAPSEVFEDFINDGKVALLSTPNLTPLQGGVPIYYENEIIGAVGISGADGETDNNLAKTIAGLIE